MIEAFNSGIELINHAGAMHWRFASAMFWQTVVLVAVLSLLELCLRRRVRPVVRYWIWSLVLLKLMLPVTLHTPASIAYWLVREPAVVADVSSSPIVDELPPPSSTPMDVTSERLQSSSGNSNVAFRPSVPPVRRGRPAELDSEPAAVAVTTPQKLASLNGSGWLLIGWGAIAVLLGVIVVRRAAKVWQLGRRATEAPRQLDDPLQVACEVLDLSAYRVRLKISEEVGCPAICGFWRPTILIPPRLINQLDEEQFQLVFAHELSHWKRWDLQINLLQTVLQVFYFYNPAVWIANAVLRRLREEAVDDAVLIAIAAPTARYSNTLLDVAAHSLRPVEINVRLIGILESRKALVNRIHRLAAGPLPNSARLGLWGFAAVVTIGVALLPMAASRRAIADKPADGSSAPALTEKPEKTAPTAALSVRITDKRGTSVSDARVQLIDVSTGNVRDPGSLGLIQGHLRFVGRRPKSYVRVSVTSLDQNPYHESIAARSDAFEAGPVPPGRYRLRFESPEIETKDVDSVIAPTDDLEVVIQVRGPIVLHGVVTGPGAKGPEPIGNFRVRVTNLKTFRGTNFTPRRPWRTFNNPQGKFSGSVPGSGIYVVEATADGFATKCSNPINADQLPKEGIRLTLSKGARLAGTVVDEAGRPIDGAVIMSLAKAGRSLPMSADSIPEGISVQTVNGRFQFDDLTPGKDTFRIVHPDYASTVVENLELRSQGQAPLAIVMKRGGTVSGHVRDDNGRLLAGVKLHFEKNFSAFVGDLGRARLATAVTDANGYYEVRHLPEQVIQIMVMRAEGPRSTGVIWQAVLPSNAQRRTVDFGGPSTVSGQLFVNGAPLASANLLLADTDLTSGAFRARAVTGPDGSFAFSGIPVGKRCLYFSDRRRKNNWDEWNRVQAIEIHSGPQNLGRIDHHVSKLTVNVVGVTDRGHENPSVELRDYNPSPFRVRFVARPRSHAIGTAFVFENVGLGKYDISGSAEGPVRVNRMIELSPDNLNPTVTFEWPHGTASIRGTIDPALRKPAENGWIELDNPDLRWSAHVQLKEDGSFEFVGIPAGVYALTLMPIRLSTLVSVLLAEFQLRDGEAKTLNINKESISQSELSKGVLAVNVFTSQGLPLPGSDIRLTGTKGVLKPNLSRTWHVWFVAPAGSYQLSAAFPGFNTVTRTIEIKPISDVGRWNGPDHNLNVTLAPID